MGYATKFSKVHYEHIAAVIKKRVDEAAAENNGRMYSTLVTITADLAQMFANDNSAFKSKTFFTACGIEL